MSPKIVITGVSQGLGQAMAVELDRLGHTVIGCARSRKNLNNLIAKLDKRHSFEQVDVASDNQVSTWAAQICDRFGPPDRIINNAALMNRPAPLWEVPEKEFSTLIDVNIKGVVNVIRHFVPRMLDTGGIIVNVSSGWGRSTAPEVGPYCASKWAIEGLSRSMAQEVPAGLACVALNPGIIDTDMLRRCWADSAAGFPKAEEWARRAVPYLLKISTADNGRPLTVP